METVAAFRASFSIVSPNRADGVGPSGFTGVPRCLLSNAWIQQRRLSHKKLCSGKVGVLSRKCIAIRASAQPSDSSSSDAPIAPLKLESPFGRFLAQMLVRHPHLIPAAVEQELELLQTDLDAEEEKEESSATGSELVLYRRIAEVKANERKRALEDILYALVVQKFIDADVRLIPAIPLSSPEPDGKLECLHSPEAYEMIKNHLTLVLGNRPGNSHAGAKISRTRIGQVYAASVMYGYFLKRIDQRFQLEKSMKTLPLGFDDEDETNNEQIIQEDTVGNRASESFRNDQPHPEVSTWSASSGGPGYSGITSSRLRTYVMSFDGETLQRYASIRSKEAIGIIEKHTEALFGKPEMPGIPEGGVGASKDEGITLSFSNLRTLILEAVTFGSFLWDVESYVDSRYHFVLN